MKRRQFLALGGASLLTAGMLQCSFSGVSQLFAEDDKSKKLLYFSRSQGFQHDPVKLRDNGMSLSDEVIKKVGKELGYDVVCAKDGTVFDGDLDQFDAFLFYTSGNLDQEKATDNSKPISAEGKKRFLDAIRSGKGFLGFHTATDTWRTHDKPLFENQKPEETDEFIRMIGGEFIIHGQQQETDVLVPDDCQLAWGKNKGKNFRHFEEWYCQKNLRSDLRVLLIQETKGMKIDGRNSCYDRPAFPAVWARKEGKGNVLYTAYGHNNALWETEDFQKQIAELIQIAVGAKKIDFTPNLDKVCPGASILQNKK